MNNYQKERSKVVKARRVKQVKPKQVKSPDVTKKKYVKHVPEQNNMYIFADKEKVFNSMKNSLIDPIVVKPVERRIDEDLVRMIELYRTKSLSAIGAIMNLSATTVFRRLKKAGIEPREPGTVV